MKAALFESVGTLTEAGMVTPAALLASPTETVIGLVAVALSVTVHAVAAGVTSGAGLQVRLLTGLGGRIVSVAPVPVDLSQTA